MFNDPSLEFVNPARKMVDGEFVASAAEDQPTFFDMGTFSEIFKRVRVKKVTIGLSCISKPYSMFGVVLRILIRMM